MSGGVKSSEAVADAVYSPLAALASEAGRPWKETAIQFKTILRLASRPGSSEKAKK